MHAVAVKFFTVLERHGIPIGETVKHLNVNNQTGFDGKMIAWTRPYGFCGDARRWNFIKSIILSKEMEEVTGFRWEWIIDNRQSRFEGTPVQNSSIKQWMG